MQEHELPTGVRAALGVAAAHCGVSPAAIIAPGRAVPVTRARALAMALLSAEGYTDQAIGALLARHHSTVIHHRQRAAAREEATIAVLRARLLAGGAAPPRGGWTAADQECALGAGLCALAPVHEAAALLVYLRADVWHRGPGAGSRLGAMGLVLLARDPALCARVVALLGRLGLGALAGTVCAQTAGMREAR